MPNHDEDGVEVESIEVTGVIEDDQGNRWAVPADNVDDLGDMEAVDPLNFPIAQVIKKDPRMTAQLIRKDELQVYLSRGWVRVTRKEVDVDGVVDDQYGASQTSYCEVGEMAYVKIPKVLADRQKQGDLRAAREAIAAVEPTAEMLEAAKKAGYPADAIRRRGVTHLRDLEEERERKAEDGVR